MNEAAKITVIAGPMFSEKSGELIKRCLKMEKFGKKRVKAYKPAEDTRFAEDYIVSRMGYRYPATAIPKELTKEIVDHILLETENMDVVAFDEVQFFSKPIMGLIEELAYRGKQVMVDGLNMDYRGKEFGYIGGILAMSEEVVKLTAFCAACNSPYAAFTQRIVNGKPAKLGPIVLIGDSENYEPRCRSCFVPPHKAS